MLYVTTRNNRDAFTAQKVLRENRGADGGFYLPFREPVFTTEQIDALAEKTFGQCVADVLNRLFKTELTAWDVDFCIGRYPVRLKPLSSRIFSGEVWHNPDWDYHRLVENLTESLIGEKTIPGDWLKIALRIAVLFGIYGQLMRLGVQSADISLVSGDFTAPISAYYARKWGLPIGNIVCSCNENKGIWDLVSYGQMRTDAVSVSTVLPEADIAVPDDLERLIYGCGGPAEVRRYLDAWHTGKMYTVGEPMLSQLRKGMAVSVVSNQRILETISGVYRTHSYLMTPATALAYAGLLDHRAKSGETRHAVIWSEKSPVCELDTIAQALGMPTAALQEKLR